MTGSLLGDKSEAEPTIAYLMKTTIYSEGLSAKSNAYKSIQSFFHQKLAKQHASFDENKYPSPIHEGL
jgi:hypothetical protein